MRKVVLVFLCAVFAGAASAQNLRQVAMAGVSPSGYGLIEVDTNGRLLSGGGFGVIPPVGNSSMQQILMMGVDSSGAFHPILMNSDGSLNVPSAAGSTLTIASGTIALSTSAITAAGTGAGSCVTTSATATGAASTDAIIWSPNASIKGVTGYAPVSTGGLTIAGYATSGNVNFDVCNWTTSTVTPGAVSLNWRIVR